jgi:ABC-type bacteriocin/lantibiotic exporter with double-glycine peptidase domain
LNRLQAGVSLDRVNKFINNPELDPKSVDHDPEVVDPILIEDGTFKWGEEEPEILKDINIRVKKGSLTAVVGTVGAGESHRCLHRSHCLH